MSVNNNFFSGLCNKPTAIDARIRGTNFPWYWSGNAVTINPAIGLQCWNKWQKNGMCRDFEVRFCCPDPEPSVCHGQWSAWIDNDNPSATGDWEVELPCNLVTSIDAREVSTKQDYTLSGNIVHLNTDHGYVWL